jgi:hypothetical protein
MDPSSEITNKRKWDMMNALDSVGNARIESLHEAISRGDMSAAEVLNNMENLELKIYRNFLHEFVYKAVLSTDEVTRKSAEILVVLNRQNINANNVNITPGNKITILESIDVANLIVSMDIVQPTSPRQAIDHKFARRFIRKNCSY